jgi:hypothetical protein
VGIEDSIGFRLPDGGVVRGYDPEADRLTRDDITAAVHFLRFDFTPEQVDAFRAGPVTLFVDHPEYANDVVLDDVRHAELASDFASVG